MGLILYFYRTKLDNMGKIYDRLAQDYRIKEGLKAWQCSPGASMVSTTLL